MPNYTKNEYVLISDAMGVASTHLNTAYDILVMFWDKYIDSEKGNRALADDILNDQHMVESFMRVIMDQLFEVKKELDVFVDDDSHVLQYFFNEAKEKQKIISSYKNQ